MTRVLVTDAGRGSAVSIIRSLGRRGIEVVAADDHPRSPGLFTRYSAGKLLYPSPVRHAREAVEVLVQAASERRIDLVIPVGEELVTILSAERERFADRAIVALPDAAALAATRDKAATVELAERLEVPTPRTVLVRSTAEALREAADFDWPVVLKPQSSRSVTHDGRIEAFQVAYARDLADLEAQMRAFEGRCAVLVQEYCPGEGHGVGLLMLDGAPVLAFQHRRLREVPLTGGPSSLRESVPLDPVLLDRSVRLLEALGWTGPAMVEFKVAGDDAKLMEINGRVWGSLPLAVRSGVDLPMGIVSVFLERARGSEGLGIYEVGVRSRDLRLELRWIKSVLAGNGTASSLAVPRRQDAVSAALRLLDPHDGYDILNWKDPLPGLVEILGLVGTVARRSVRRRGGVGA